MIETDEIASLKEGQILDALANPILVIGAANTVLAANAAAEEFFQASLNKLRRLKISDIIPFSSPLATLVAQAIEDASPIQEYGVNIGTPRTGGERVVDLQVAPATETPGTAVIMIQLRSVAQNLDRQLTHRGAARSVTGMASMLAHEIKNPLAGIRGAAQLLEPVLGEEDRALASLICTETDRIRDLVDQMEVFSDERPLERSAINIHGVLGYVRQVAGTGFARGITISENYDPSLPPVYGNHDQLVQVFLNLVKNAAEAITSAGNGGEIGLSTAFRPGVRLTNRGTGDKVSLPLEVCVRDEGGGVSDDMLPYLFDPFVTNKSQGRGLGLALVAKIIRDHGGVVECQSTKQGALFRVLLPKFEPLPEDEERHA